MGNQSAHVLIEMASEPDCRFIGSWFIKAAEAQGLWSQALRNSSFREWMLPLWEYVVPDLECAALFFFGQLEQQHRVIAVDVDGDLTVELAMMVHLGFFVRAGQGYRLAVPESVTLERMQEAAVRVMSTARDLGFGAIAEPELLLHTVPEAEAEAWRSWIIQMRRLNPRAVVRGVRLSLSNAAVRIGMNGTSDVGRKMQLARKNWVLFAGG
jgi:hypothetical protein